MNIKVNAHRVNETRHFCALDEKQLERIITEAVAKAAGIDLGSKGVKIERCWIRTEHKDGHGSVAKAEVQIIVEEPAKTGGTVGVSIHVDAVGTNSGKISLPTVQAGGPLHSP